MCGSGITKYYIKIDLKMMDELVWALDQRYYYDKKKKNYIASIFF